MKKVVISKYGGPEVLKLVDAKKDDLGPRQIRLKTHFAGVNFSEIMARMRLYPGAPAPPSGIGVEASGIVESIGDEVSRYAVGDRVMGLCKYSSYASHVTMDEDMAIPVPDHFTMEHAAAFPVIYMTAYMMIFDQCNIRKGDSILILGAGGGVGTALIHLSKLVGAKILAASSSWKHGKIQELGADICIDYRSQNWEGKIHENTDGLGADIIIVPLGAASWKKMINCLAPLGKLVIYGDQYMVSGPRANIFRVAKEFLSIPKFNPLKMMSKNQAVVGFHLGRLMGMEKKVQRSLHSLIAMVEANGVLPVVDKSFHGSKAADAHSYIQDRKNFGKVLIDFRDIG